MKSRSRKESERRALEGEDGIPAPIPGFDCLAFTWKVQSEIYEKTKNMTVEEQIAFFRHAVETGPFADLVRAIAAREDDASQATKATL